MNRLVIATFFIGILTTTLAHPAESKCNKPPYGGTTAEFKAFIKNLGFYLDSPADTLKKVCNAKFYGIGRESLYNFGLTDSDFESKDTYDLTIDIMRAAGEIYRNRNESNE